MAESDWVTIDTPVAPVAPVTPIAPDDSSWQTITPVGGAPVAVGPAPDKYQQAAIEDRNALLAKGITPPGEGYTGRVINAAALGWGDEINAALRAPIEMFRHGGVSLPDAYRYAKAQEDLAAQQREQNTAGALGVATDILGGAGGTAGSAILGGTRLAGPVRNYLANIGKTAAVGAVGGAGEAPTLAEVPGQALTGAALGSVLGAVAPPVIKTVSGAVRGVVAPFRRPENAATNYLASVIENARINPETMLNQVREAHLAGQPFTLADAIGYEGRRALAAMAKQPGPQRDLVTEAMLRSVDMPARVGTQLGEALQAPTTARAATLALQQQAANEARPLYQAAEQVPTYSPRIQQFLEEPIVRQGLRRGVELQRLEALAEGRPFNPFDLIQGVDAEGLPILQGVPNMRTLHTAKVGLDAMEEAAREATPYGARATMQSRAIGNVRRSFLDAIDAENPLYAQARQAYAGPMQVRDAVQLGRDMARSGRAADNIARFNALSPLEQAGARIGYADAIRQPLERSGNYPALLRDKSQKGSAELAAFATPDQADPLRRYLTREQAMLETQRHAVGGSPTAENLADLGAAPGGLPEALGLGHAIASGHPAQMARAGLSLLGQAAQPLRERQRMAITRALLAQDPQTVADLTREITALANRRRGVNPFVNRPPRYRPPY